MGQTRPVQVYVLVTEGTLEEKLLATLSAKHELAQAALDVDSDVDAVELVSGMEVGMAQSAISSDEAAILKELEAPAAEKSLEAKPESATPDAVAEAKSKSRQQRDKAQAE